MKKEINDEHNSDPINYIYIPTKKYRIRRILFGRYIVEKQIAVYNLFGPGKQSCHPIRFFWNVLTDLDVAFGEIDLDSIFELKTLDIMPRNRYK